MGFIKGKVKDFYLLTTDVETIFINEYLPAAPGDYVKVYLYGLLYAQTGADMDARTFAQQLRLPDETIRQAWEYWESMGAVRRVKGKSGGADTAVPAAGMQEDIEFRNLRAMMYGNGGMEGSRASSRTGSATAASRNLFKHSKAAPEDSSIRRRSWQRFFRGSMTSVPRRK